jgi:hypothetical protein
VLGEKEEWVIGKISIPDDIFGALQYHWDRKAITITILGTVIQPGK